jgi:MoxR-like ATPase
MQSRDYVLPDDVKRFVKPALSHRFILQPDLWSSPQAADRVIAELLQFVPVPVMRS